MKDVHTKCSRLHKNDAEKLGLLLRGLRPQLRKFVLAHSPTTASEAESYARLAESINAIPDSPDSARGDRIQAMLTSIATPLDMRVGQLKEDLDQLRKIVEAAMKSREKEDLPRFGEFDSTRPNSTYEPPRCYECGSTSHLARTCERRRDSYFNNNRYYNNPGGQNSYRAGQNSYRGGQNNYRGGQGYYRGGRGGYRGNQYGYRGGQNDYRGNQGTYRLDDSYRSNEHSNDGRNNQAGQPKN